MRKTILALIAAIAMSGCASFKQQAIDKESLAGIKDQTVTYTAREKPDFSAMTAGKAAFAMVGAIAMITEGNSIISTNNIADPANTIATGLVKELEVAYGVQLITPPTKVSTNDPTQIALSVKSTARYVIDVQTIYWGFVYFPTDWTHYRVLYTAKARLIDIQTKRSIAEGFCKHKPESNVNAPTYDELITNQAAGLKNNLNLIAQECINSMKIQMLTL